MTGRVRYKPNPLAVQLLARSVEMDRYLNGVAKAAASEAQRRVPYPDILGGIRVEGGTRSTKRGREGIVSIHGPGWHFWEYGTVNHGPRPAIRPGVQAVLSRVGGRWRSN